MQAKILVEGMTCTNCALSVKKTLNEHGLKDVNVDFASGEVVYNSATQHSLKDISDWINRIGYKVLKGEATEQKGLKKLENRFIFCLVFTLPLFFAMFLPFKILHNGIFQVVICIPVMVVGFSYFFKSARGSVKSGLLNMDVLIAVGSGAAFIYSFIGLLLYYGTPEIHNFLFFDTTATIITLVLLGNVFEHRSVKKTTSSIAALKKLQKAAARKIDGDKIIEITADEVKINDILIVNEGDIIPVDAEVVWGSGYADESMITGESEGVLKGEKNTVIGGTILSSGSIKIKATKVGEASTLSSIIELVKNAKNKQPHIQRLGDKVSAVFVPVVIGISVLTFLLAYFVFGVGFEQSLMQSIAVLVISCPCAMGLATPTALMVGLGKAARKGILIKGGNTIEQFSGIETIVFDKTGTLTTGKFKIKNIEVQDENFDLSAIQDLIFSVEKHSSHPLAKSIVNELQAKVNEVKISDIKEEKGKGISFSDENGNCFSVQALKEKNKSKNNQIDTQLGVYKDELLVASIDLNDEIAEGIKESISILHKKGIETVLLSGDRKEKCEALAKELNIDEVFSEQTPEQKLNVIDELNKSRKVAMVGDGINDAPALSKANIGISLSTANQIAIESAEIVLLGKNALNRLVDSLKISQKTMKTIKQNLFWALFYNVLAIPLAAFGFLNPMVAALAMACSDVVVVGNSLRMRLSMK